ncbi:MAG: DUF4878 domain-containing protein [Prevotellaceae bacterium]|jgi:hypothetical protein|nr:DUF4878 domain-containing protein [Prevotellaceae bacterium]
MNKTIFLAALVVALTCVMNACEDSASPKGITNSLYSALKKGDYQKAASVFAENAASEDALTAEEIQELAVKLETEGRQNKMLDYKITGETVADNTDGTGKTTTVCITASYEDGTEEQLDLTFIQKDGKWKMDLFYK